MQISYASDSFAHVLLSEIRSFGALFAGDAAGFRGMGFESAMSARSVEVERPCGFAQGLGKNWQVFAASLTGIERVFIMPSHIGPSNILRCRNQDAETAGPMILSNGRQLRLIRTHGRDTWVYADQSNYCSLEEYI